MENSTRFYLGIDVSKLWFDISMMAVIDHQKQPIQSKRFDNTGEGLRLFGRWLKECKVPMDENSLLVIENTGVYHRLIWQYCSLHGLPLHIGNAAQIKWSLGITRGKNDVIDSVRLCNYCYRHADELKATPVLNPMLLRLKDLMTARTRILAQINSNKVYLNELKSSEDKNIQQIMRQAYKAAMEGLEKSLDQVAAQIKQIVQEDKEIKHSYDLLLSVPGIGHITAVYLICCTGNFTGGIKGKNLASYAGVAPFSNTSGTSIKGRNKVNKMANKDLKKLLYLCAMSAKSHYPEFSTYYERKKAEGKHHNSIINAISSKIALRVAAVINNQQQYVDNYKNAA